jgi:NAD(P)-dependent dehydrogenase (short-subunit alcohol dehydrogenase family)
LKNVARAEIVVTGASVALGAGVVEALIEDGERVVAIGRNAEQLTRLFGNREGCRIAAFEVTESDAWQGALGAGDFSGAVLAAGSFRGGKRLFEDSSATWQAMFDANLETARASMQALLPRMVRAGNGSIVVVGSRAAARPWEGANAAAYAASKAAVVALVQAVAAEVIGDGVRVNAVLPSTIDTEANRRAMPDSDHARWVTIDSLASVIRFLLSDAARDISGAQIPVYGRAGA